MIYTKGDPLWIPQAALLYRGLNNPQAVKFNNEPKVALFLENSSYDGFIEILLDGENWIVERKHTRKITKEKKC